MNTYPFSLPILTQWWVNIAFLRIQYTTCVSSSKHKSLSSFFLLFLLDWFLLPWVVLFLNSWIEFFCLVLHVHALSSLIISCALVLIPLLLQSNMFWIIDCFCTNPLYFSIMFYQYLFLWFCNSFQFPWWLDIWFNDGSLSVHLILICCAKCKSHLSCCFALIVLDFWCVVKFLLLIYMKHIYLEGCVRILVWTDSMLCKLICFSLYTTVLPCCVNIPDEHL